MNPVPMQCPLCAGTIQIDPAHAGQQVACPLCQVVLALPPPEFFGLPPAHYPPANDPPSHPAQELFSQGYPQEVSASLPQLACPICGGAFQVSPQMAGQQVACPHCQSAVSIPDIFAGPPAGYAPPQPMQFIGLPPGAGAPSELPPAAPEIPTGMAVAAAPPLEPRQAAPEQTAPQQPASQPPVEDRYPPTSRPRTKAPGEESRDDRFPPGMGKGKPREAQSLPRDRPVTEREQRYPPGFKPREEPAVETKGPTEQQRPAPETIPAEPPSPVQEPVPSVDDLLPPGAADASPIAAEPELVVREQTAVDALLPPGAPADAAAMPAEQIALPDAPAPAPRPVPAAGPGRVVLPTPDGDFVTVEDKAGVTTISDRGEEIEIRKLSPAERTRRRRVKNIVMFTLAVLLLVIVIVIMTRK
jgi:hypothetical protein